MTLVVDSSAVVAALVGEEPDGEWARTAMQRESLVAPTHVHVEASNVIRRLVLTDLVSRDLAVLMHEELGQLRITTFPFLPLAARVWDLHPNITAYDAAYVALAEELDAPLLTLDHRLARSTGPACTFLLPPEGRGGPG
jgi:predicted nucleic acid-binding protein